MRFARLSWIRKILGGRPDEVEHPYDAETFVEDDEYLILDIVLNWVRRECVLKAGYLMTGRGRITLGILPCNTGQGSGGQQRSGKEKRGVDKLVWNSRHARRCECGFYV